MIRGVGASLQGSGLRPGLHVQSSRFCVRPSLAVSSAIYLGFGVWGLGFGVWGLGYLVKCLGFRVQGLLFKI